MDRTQTSVNDSIIDWNSTSNHLLLNPRYSLADQKSLEEVARKVESEFALKGHIWISTSGSTSHAVTHNKLVALPKSAFLTSAAAVNAHLGVTKEDHWLQVLPRFHVGGLGIEARAFLSSSKVTTEFSKWDANATFELIREKSISIAAMVPTQIYDLVRLKLPSPNSLRAVIVGGGALTESLYLEARALGWPLLPSYGMTETCSQIATAQLSSLNEKKMPLAKKLAHVEWRAGAEGILQVRGPSLLTCYAQRERNGQVMGWDPRIDGWFQAEDYVELQDGEIRVLGRKNDFIKIGGEGTSISKLREAFEKIQLSQVQRTTAQMILIDAPSERLENEIHLVYDNAKDLESVRGLAELFNSQVLPFERIRQMKYIQKIPRTELGKVLWSQLKRELYGS